MIATCQSLACFLSQALDSHTLPWVLKVPVKQDTGRSSASAVCLQAHVLNARQQPVDLCSCAQAKLVILGSQTTLRSVPHFAQVRGLHTLVLVCCC